MYPEEMPTKLFSEHVLRHKGSVVLVRNVRNKLSSNNRPSLEEAVKQMEALKDEGLGDVVSHAKTKAFIKQTPNKVSNALLKDYGLDLKEYTTLFLAKDMELQQRHKAQLLQLSEIGKEVLEYEEAQKENACGTSMLNN